MGRGQRAAMVLSRGTPPDHSASCRRISATAGGRQRMTVNGSAPASVSATEGKGRKTDQLDGSITSKNNVHADANQDRRRDLVPLEAAAAELELSPFWLRQRLRACGIEEIWLQRVGYIRLADLKALKEADQETKKKGRARSRAPTLPSSAKKAGTIPG